MRWQYKGSPRLGRFRAIVAIKRKWNHADRRSIPRWRILAQGPPGMIFSNNPRLIGHNRFIGGDTDVDPIILRRGGRGST